jgi:hypothetical protein
LKREISRINIAQVDKRKIWKAYDEKKIKSTLWTKFQQHFMRKKFNSSSWKIIEDHFVEKNSKTSNEQKVSNTHFQKFNCNLWRNNWTSWTSKKIMSPLCLLNFLHVVLIVNLKHATQPLQKLERGSSFGHHYWGHQCPRISLRFIMFAKWGRGEVETNTLRLHHWSLDWLHINIILGIYQGLKPNLTFPYWNIALKRPH